MINRHQYLKCGSIQQVTVARFTSTQKRSCLRQHSTLNGKVHLSFSKQPSYFPPQPAFSMSSLASPSSFDLQPQNLMPSYDMTILSPQHMTITTNTYFHSQLIYCFLQNQHEHQICRSLSVFALPTTHCSHHGSFCPS